MRRILSMAVMLVLSLGPMLAAVPALALASGWTGKIDQSRIPACCRRNGTHHCTMAQDAQASPHESAVSAPGCCPCLPPALASATTPFAGLPSSGASSLALSAERSSSQARIETARASDRRVQPLRGPPLQSL